MKEEIPIYKGDKVVYFSNSEGLKTGIVKDVLIVDDPLIPKYYVIDNYDRFVAPTCIMKYNNDLDVYPKEEAKKSKKYRHKEYNYLFMTYEQNIGIKIHSIKINSTDKFEVLQMICKLFPKVTNFYKNDLFVLTQTYDWRGSKIENIFVPLKVDMFKSKFNIQIKEWTRLPFVEEQKEWTITFLTDINVISKEIGKDIKYLLGDLRYCNYYNWAKKFDEYNGDSYLIELYDKLQLDIYFKAKKDLCSNGDELLF